MTTYQRKQTPERVEAVRLTGDNASVRGYLHWFPAVAGHWLVVSPTSQRFMSDYEFRREFEEVKAPSIPRCLRCMTHPEIEESKRRASLPVTPDGEFKMQYMAETPRHVAAQLGVDKPSGWFSAYMKGVDATWAKGYSLDTNQPVEHFNGGWWSERRGETSPTPGVAACVYSGKHVWRYTDDEEPTCENCGLTKP